MTPPDHVGEAAPWPYVSQAHRARRLAARLMLFGAVVLVASFAIRYGAEWAAGLIYGTVS